MNIRRRLIAAALASPVVLAACKVRTINDFPVTPADVRALNLMLGSTAIDIVEGDNIVFGAVAFEVGTDFVEFNNERKTFGLRITGQATTVASLDIALAGEQAYTLIAFGTLEDPQFMLAPDVTTSQAGSVQLRLVNASFVAFTYDLYITGPLVPIEEVGPNFVGLSAGSSTVSLRFEQGFYRLRATPNGSKQVIYDSGVVDFTTSTSSDIVLYTLGSQALPSGMVLDVNDPQRRLLLPSSIAGVRLINAAYQSGPIIGNYDGTIFAPQTVYPGFNGYAFVAAGLHTVTVESTATPGAPLASLAYTFPPALDTTVVALGPGGAVQIVPFADDNRSPAPGTARVRFINAGSDNAAYDVFIGDTRQVVALPPRTASPYIVQPEGTYVVTFRDPASGAIALTFDNVELPSGRVMTLYLAGVAGALTTISTTER